MRLPSRRIRAVLALLAVAGLAAQFLRYRAEVSLRTENEQAHHETVQKMLDRPPMISDAQEQEIRTKLREASERKHLETAFIK